MNKLFPILMLAPTVALAGLYGDTPDAKHAWSVHDYNRPNPVKIDPAAAAGQAPSDARVLFDGTAESLAKNWCDGSGRPTKWKYLAEDRAFGLVAKDGKGWTTGAGTIFTREKFGDCQLHLEFRHPAKPEGREQMRGNSGVFLMGNYEIQVMDSYDTNPAAMKDPNYADGQCGAVYAENPPLVNANRRPGEWQVYDIVFHQPVWKGRTLLHPGSVTVFLNGVLVQDHWEMEGLTTHCHRRPLAPHATTGALQLQDHGCSIMYRNVWYRPLASRWANTTHSVMSANANDVMRLRRETAAKIFRKIPDPKKPVGSTVRLLAEVIAYSDEPKYTNLFWKALGAYREDPGDAEDVNGVNGALNVLIRNKVIPANTPKVAAPKAKVKIDFFAKDLTKLDAGKVKKFKPDVIDWIRWGTATMPIVAKAGPRRYGSRGWEIPPDAGAERLAALVYEITGVKPPIVIEKEGTVATNAPAVYVGSSACKKFAVKEGPNSAEGFRIVSENGSLYFAGHTGHAVSDFAERVLGVRAYWEGKMGGWSYVRTSTLKLPEIDYSDSPVYARRLMWPFAHNDWYSMWKCGNSWPIHCDAHQPYKWWGETNFNYKVTRPEIFQLGRDGKRQPPMLCYGNPKTFETYKERLELELAGGPKAGMYNAAAKTVSVSQWDGLIDCQCEYCKKLYAPECGTTGNASPIIWGFAAKLAAWCHEKHPDMTVTILPYLNTCDIPKGLAFPYKNVEAEVCSMPGLALFKNKDVQEHEETLIKDWAKVTGRPIRSWNYLCWPAEFCNAPYAFGHAAVAHYKRMKGYMVGAFMNGTGTPPERRVMISAYVWMRAMWNPELDVEAVYDGMCARMFGPAAKPMRKFLAMQEAGWNRQWGAGQVSNKNIYEISYPRKDVIEMERLLAEARKLVGTDKLVNRRLDRYTEGFAAFFEESKNLAEGTALEPTLIKKVGSDPIVDGVLDDEAWKLATAYPFVHARNKEKPQPKYPTTVRMVWTPNGVTFGFDCTEPYAGDAEIYKKFSNPEEIEIFLDPSGTGDGHWYQIFTTDRAEPLFYTDGPKWLPKTVKAATHFEKGRWGMEIFVPFAELKGFPKAQFPEGTTAAGKFWIGNVMRNRAWDGWRKKKDKIDPNSTQEFSRRYTRYSVWSKDASAFGKLQFVE